MDLLTDKEHELMQDISKVACGFWEICNDVDGDYHEVVFYIHGLQNMILAQAAARAYPDKYRLMTGSPKE